jgi:hypothetical protein
LFFEINGIGPPVTDTPKVLECGLFTHSPPFGKGRLGGIFWEEAFDT